MIAALYVDPKGIYSTLEGVDPWGPDRDARTYLGPHPVVAHPPCQRYGRYWRGGPSASFERKLADDGGCFKCALADVRRWSGVLEHPEASHAWRLFDIHPAPPRSGGWVRTLCGGWTCCVEQGHYGHRARKATWLYAYGLELPELIWGPSEATCRLDRGYHTAEERRAARAHGEPPMERLRHGEHEATPPAFAAVLLEMARTARRAA